MIEVWRHHRVIGNVAVFTLVAVFLCLVLAILGRTSSVVDAIRATQKTNTSLVTETRENTDLIRSCVNPDGRCYKRGQARTASAVEDINRVIILAAACASGLPPAMNVAQQQTQIQTCVIDRLAQQSAKGRP